MQAKLVRHGDVILVYTPYNPRFVEEIRGIPGRRWHSKLEAWSVPLGSEKQIRILLRQFFKVEGEFDSPLISMRVRIESHDYPLGHVLVDGKDIFDPSSGYLDMRSNGSFEILDYEGGLIYSGGSVHGSVIGISYVVYIKTREGAEWSKRGKCSYEFLDRQAVPDVFMQAFSDKEV